MAKSTLAFTIVLFLLISVTSRAIRPTLLSDSTQQASLDEEKLDAEESCEGVGEDDCLMRRTLAAHIDYIYTQNKNP